MFEFYHKVNTDILICIELINMNIIIKCSNIDNYCEELQYYINGAHVFPKIKCVYRNLSGFWNASAFMRIDVYFLKNKPITLINIQQICMWPTIYLGIRTLMCGYIWEILHQMSDLRGWPVTDIAILQSSYVHGEKEITTKIRAF